MQSSESELTKSQSTKVQLKYHISFSAGASRDTHDSSIEEIRRTWMQVYKLHI